MERWLYGFPTGDWQTVTTWTFAAPSLSHLAFLSPSLSLARSVFRSLKWASQIAFVIATLQFGAAVVVIWQMNGLFLVENVFQSIFIISSLLLSLLCPPFAHRRSLQLIVIGHANSSAHNLMSSPCLSAVRFTYLLLLKLKYACHCIGIGFGFQFVSLHKFYQFLMS